MKKIYLVLFMALFFISLTSAQIYTVATDSGWNSETDTGIEATGILTNNYNVYLQNFTIGNIVGGSNPTNGYIIAGGFGYPCNYSQMNILRNVSITYNGTAGIVSFSEVNLSPNTYYALAYDSIGNSFGGGYQIVTHPIGNAPDIQTTWRTLCGLNQTISTGLVTTIGETNTTTIIPPPPALEVTINNPPDNFTINSNRGRLNGTVINNWNNATIRNLTWFTNFTGSLRGSHTVTGITNNTLNNWFFPAQLDGYYEWLLESCNNQSKCFNSTSRFFTLDDIPQVAVLVSPLNNASLSSQIVTLTAYTSHDDSANLTFYINDTGTFHNISTINNPISFVNYSRNVNLSFNATYFWSAYTCDPSGYCNFSTANRTFTDFFNPPVVTPLFYFNFTTLEGVLIIGLLFLFSLFLFFVGMQTMSAFIFEIIGFLFLFNSFTIIGIIFVLFGFVLLFSQKGGNNG